MLSRRRDKYKFRYPSLKMIKPCLPTIVTIAPANTGDGYLFTLKKWTGTCITCCEEFTTTARVRKYCDRHSKKRMLTGGRTTYERLLAKLSVDKS